MPTIWAAHLNGRPATAGDLAPLAFAGYAHFTAMQVRDGRVRGLDLHLERLRAASAELFGRTLSDERVRSFLRAAVAAGPPDLSLTAHVYAPGFAAAGAEPDVLVRTGPAATPPEGPLALAAAAHERFLPHVKQAGEAAKTYHLRRAAAEGLDDAAFVDRRGRLSEATIWNLAFWDGSAVVWPVAARLGGVTMGVVRRRLAALGVPQLDREVTLDDLPGLAGAVVMNSWTPAVPVHRIGAADLPPAPSFVKLLHRAYQDEPPVSP
ncbi:aminotransferase class IV family protein [Actinomadura sp. ATCC 31491]|uniref:Aminotransferase class IV family protein n=1 Tax=Actinomadura luzonensis TaxID=2805427 RepID=A0ABT0FTX3_9ACTN|nr:aminotransferase class IV family protein [Actinomadura luzonensis]MCK2215714.1 aminotransferase class IV family protein [Actinomadura luzonensis]